MLLTAIPFGCASLLHLANCWHSQRVGAWPRPRPCILSGLGRGCTLRPARTRRAGSPPWPRLAAATSRRLQVGERRWHIAVPWAVGAVGMMAMPLAWSSPAAAFALLVVTRLHRTELDAAAALPGVRMSPGACAGCANPTDQPLDTLDTWVLDTIAHPYPMRAPAPS